MSMVFLGLTHCKKCWAKLDGAIGLCESCRKVEEQEKKLDNKYKLIDILNKIANGELKEGTKVKWDIFEYTYKKGDCYEEYLERKVDNFDYVDILDDMYLRNLNAEVELIEPNDFADDGKMAETTDNTKIEELDKEEMLCLTLQCAIAVLTDKLNEVICKLNKEDKNE